MDLVILTFGHLKLICDQNSFSEVLFFHGCLIFQFQTFLAGMSMVFVVLQDSASSFLFYARKHFTNLGSAMDISEKLQPFYCSLQSLYLIRSQYTSLLGKRMMGKDQKGQTEGENHQIALQRCQLSTYMGTSGNGSDIPNDMSFFLLYTLKMLVLIDSR